MPLARIITDSVDDSLELTMQLRARGFLVETVSPDQVPDTPADLEVRMEECSPEEVLNKAAAVSGSEDLWVFVAPGALDERARPIRTIPLLPHGFDVPSPRMIPRKFETTWPVEAMRENGPSEVLAPLVAKPMRVSAEIPVGPGNGGAKSEIAADLKKESAIVPPVIVPHGPAKPTPDVPPKMKVVVLPKLNEVPQIPEVPERAQPMSVATAPKVTVGRVRLRGPYKISFRTGARFWKPIAVSGVLAVVAGLLVAAVALRPHSPQSAKPASTGPAAAGVKVNPTKPSSSSVTVKSSTPPVGAPGQLVVPPVAPVPGRAIPQVAGPSVPQIAAKPAAESAARAAAKSPQAKPQNVPAKPAASPAATNANKAQPVRRHAGSSEADVVAEDTVVFYNHKPASPSAKTPQESGVKQ